VSPRDDGRPVLTVAIPTYRRPDDLRRAIGSVCSAAAPTAGEVELLVSDNSPDDDSEHVADALLPRWQGPARYVRLPPDAGAVGNFNACVAEARGRWLLLLHDDDALLPGGLQAVLDAVSTARPGDAALLFGVHVVDGQGRVLRRQEHPREQRLDRRHALRAVLTDSSFVRFPAIVVRADAYDAAGPFAAGVGGATDLDMWVRLFSRHGVRLLPSTTCTYTVHTESWTTGMFKEETLAAVDRVFAGAATLGVLDARELGRCRAAFVHQFLLGGAVRSLRAGDTAQARAVLRLFATPSARSAGVSWRWLPVRGGVRLAAGAPARLVRALLGALPNVHLASATAHRPRASLLGKPDQGASHSAHKPSNHHGQCRVAPEDHQYEG
jgi:hypothetical protein